MNWNQKIKIDLANCLKNRGLRTRTTVEKGNSRFLIHEGKQYKNFSSNDYLGLSEHPSVIQTWKEGAKKFGVGSGGSGHINGYTIAHKKLEEVLAEWLGYPRALLFTSGFSANQSVIITLLRKDDRIIADRLSHASLLEAASLSAAQLCRFSHNDILSLRKLLDKTCNGRQLVITEGIFSMDGDSAPLSAIYSLVKEKKAWLMVDDAHGFGLIGNRGRGSCNAQDIKPELLIITFGKSVGVSGAAVLCDEDIAQYLLQFSRHLIYSTSMPPAQAMSILTAIEIIKSDDGEYRRQNLMRNIHFFREELNRIEQKITATHSAIQPLFIGDNIQALHMVQRLRDFGIWTMAIRPPAVPVGTARLRLTLTSEHKLKDITALLEAIHDVNR